MTKLDEIEASWHTCEGSLVNEAGWMESNGLLLIRAVRQLGERNEALTVNFDSLYVFGAIEKRTPVDPDVLELLNE